MRVVPAGAMSASPTGTKADRGPHGHEPHLHLEPKERVIRFLPRSSKVLRTGWDIQRIPQMPTPSPRVPKRWGSGKMMRHFGRPIQETDKNRKCIRRRPHPERTGPPVSRKSCARFAGDRPAAVTGPGCGNSEMPFRGRAADCPTPAPESGAPRRPWDRLVPRPVVSGRRCGLGGGSHPSTRQG